MQSLRAHLGAALLAIAFVCYKNPLTLSSTPIQLQSDQSLNVNAFAGADLGEKVNAACKALGSAGGAVVIPASAEYVFSTPINLSDGCVISGQGPEGTTLLWTGGGAAISAINRTRIRIRELRLRTTTSSGIAIKLAGCLDCSIDDVYIRGEDAGTGWDTGIQVTKADVRSANTTLRRLRIEHTLSAGIRIDNATDTFISESSIFAIPNTSRSVALLVDSGTSGLFIQSVSTGFGKNGLKLQRRLEGKAPMFLFLDQFLADTTSGGDGVLFDESLGDDTISFQSTNLWSAGAGRSMNNGQITPRAAGINISGGKQIAFYACRLRANDFSGATINTAKSSDITFDGCYVTENNQGNHPDGDGFSVNAAAKNMAFLNNRIANLPSGGQKYGIKVGTVRASNLRIIGNDLTNNAAGPLLNGNLDTTTVIGNDSGGDAIENRIRGPLNMTAPLLMSGNSIRGVAFIESGAQNVSTAGILRGAANDILVSWRNSANTANISISKDTLDRINLDGGIQVESGVSAGGSGIKHGKVEITACPSTGCSATVAWIGNSFVDAEYTATCTVQDATPRSKNEGLRLAKISLIDKQSITVDIDNLSGSAISGFLHCIAMHR